MGGCCGRRDDCSTPYSSIYDINVSDLDGFPVKLSQFQGQVLLIVNVASKCGMTMKYYHQLNDLQARYKDRGFTVLGFPCNQFFRQESGSCPQIKEFLSDNGVTFPVFNKLDVNGHNAHELFKYLRFHSRLDSSRIGWNFGKFLITRDGRIVNYYGPRTEPMEVVPEIEKLL